MKKTLLSIFTVFLVTFASAQSGNSKQMPNMDDIQKMMKEAMKDMPPEAKKMMDSLGMKMPDATKATLPKGTSIESLQKQSADLKEQAIKDKKAALASLPKNVLTDAELAVFLKKCFEEVDKTLNPETRTNAQEIYTNYKTKGYTNEQLGGLAFGLIYNNAKDQALWILAKAASLNPTDADLLNNFASLVTQAGGARLAIPILQNLNKKIPNNEIILNNLGQAYYDLGDIDKAEENLRLVLKILPFSGTANQTMSDIAAAKGNKEEAVTFLKKSIQSSYSEEKVKKLKKMGYTVSKNDLALPFVINPDPLGLRNISIPAFAKSIADSKGAALIWDKFIAGAKIQAANYKAQAAALKPAADEKAQERIQDVLHLKNVAGPLMSKASYFILNENINGMEQSLKLAEFQKQIAKAHEDKEKREKQIQIEFEKTFPDNGAISYNGKDCDFMKSRMDQSNNTYLGEVSKIAEQSNKMTFDDLIIADGMAINNSLFSGKSDEENSYLTATLLQNFWDNLSKISHEEIEPVVCNEKPKEKNKGIQDWEKIHPPGCPLDIDVGVGPIDVKYDCKEFEAKWKLGLALGVKTKNFNFNTMKGDFDLDIGAGFKLGLHEGKAVNVGLEGSNYFRLAVSLNGEGVKINDVAFREEFKVGASANFNQLNELLDIKDIEKNDIITKLNDKLEDKLGDKFGVDVVKFEGGISFKTGSTDYSFTTPLGKIDGGYTVPPTPPAPSNIPKSNQYLNPNNAK